MERIDVDVYDGDVSFESEDDQVTRALIFYLRAKGVAEVVTAVGIITCLIGGGFAVYKVMSLVLELFTKI